MTKYGKGGWYIRWRFYMYTNPITGHGFASDRLRDLIHNRKCAEVEEMERAFINQKLGRVTIEP